MLERIGSTMTSDLTLVKLLSYILLFLCDFNEPIDEQEQITSCQETMIRMLQRYVFNTYPRKCAVMLYSKVLNCIGDLQELTWIKKKRQMAANSANLMENEDVLPTDANKPKNF